MCMTPRLNWKGRSKSRADLPTRFNRSGRSYNSAASITPKATRIARKKIAGDEIDAATLHGMRSLAPTGMTDLDYTLLSRGESGEARAYFQQPLDFARYDKTARTEARAR